MVTPLSLANLGTPPTAEEWNAEEFAVAAVLGLPTTAMQQGQIERTIFAVVARIQNESDIAASLMIQAGFLDFAATGFVTYTALDGSTVTQYVTPDPSIPAQNPTAALGWLDVLADSLYDVQRILSTFAGGTLALVNTSASTYGAFAAGTYHVSQPTATGSPGYTNTASLTIPPTAASGTSVSTVANSAGLVEVTTTSNHGLLTGAVVMVVGVTGVTPLVAPYKLWTITVTGPALFTLDGSTFAGTYTGAGKVYVPQTAAFTADLPGSASSASAANLVTQPVTSLIGVSVTNTGAWVGDDIEGNVALAARCRLKLQALAVGSPSGAFAYYALVAQQLALLLTPPQTMSTAINRVRVVLDITTGTVTVTVAAAGGVVGSPDLTVLGLVFSAYIGIMTGTLVTQSAAAHAVAVVSTIFLPAAYNTAANVTYFSTAILNYFRALPIGGVTDTTGAVPNTNVVPFDAVVGAIFRAGAAASIPVQNADLTLAGATLNVQLLLTPVPEIAVPSISVTLVSV